MATLLVPVAVSGSGKSSMVRRWVNEGRLPADAVICPDDIRKQMTGDVMDQSANAQVFQVARTIASARLARELIVFMDATNLTEGARSDLIGLAERHRANLIWLRFLTPFKVAIERNFTRDRQVPREVLTRQMDAFAALDWSALPGIVLDVDVHGNFPMGLTSAG